MLISIEDYLARRRQSRTCVRALKVVAAAGTASASPAQTPARAAARVYVLPVVMPAAALPLAGAPELGALYAEASLI